MKDKIIGMLLISAGIVIVILSYLLVESRKLIERTRELENANNRAPTIWLFTDTTHTIGINPQTFVDKYGHRWWANSYGNQPFVLIYVDSTRRLKIGVLP